MSAGSPGSDVEPRPSLRSEARSAVLWSAAEKWGTRGATLVVFAILARVLAPEDFGTVAAATLVLGIAGLLVDAGFGKYLIQARTVDAVTTSTVFWVSTGVSVLCAAVCVAVATPLADVFSAPDLPLVLRALALTIVANALAVVPAALMQRELQFRPLAMRRLWATLASAVAGVGLALAGAGVWALVAQALVAAFVGSAVLYAATPWRPSRQFSRAAAREAFSFGSSMLGIEALTMVGRNGDNLLIGVVLGAKALGYYVVAYRILVILLDVLTSVTGAVALPLFTRVRDDPPRLHAAFLTVIRAGSGLALPIFAGLLVVAPRLLPLLFGDEWTRSVPVMQWLTVAGLVQALTYFDRSLLLAVGKVRLELVVTTIATVGNVVAFAVAVPYGITAVAAAYAVRNLAFWPVRLWALRTAGVDLAGYGRAVLPAGLAALGCALAAAVPLVFMTVSSDVLVLAVAVVLGVVAYGVLLRAASPSTVREMIGMVRR